MTVPTAAPAPAEPRQSEPWVITLANGKGGSGKTSCALLLAATVADVSGRCLLVDTDSQGSASEVCAAAGDSLPFEYAAERDPAVLQRLRAARSVDTIIVDTAGSLVENPAALAAVVRVSDLVLIPCVPERQSITPTLRTAELVAELGRPSRVVLNQVDPLRGTAPVESAWALLDARGLPRLRTVLRRYVSVPASQLEGRMLTQYRGDRSWRPALDDARRLQTEVLLLLGRTAQERAQ